MRYLEQRLTVRHLRVIDAIERCKSLMKASGELGVSQPALTRTLHEIEDIIGSALFERHARGLSANSVGLLLADGARRLLRELRQIEDDLAAMTLSRKWTIRVGAAPVAANGIMPAVIARTSSRAAQLNINLVEDRTDNLVPALLNGEIDVIVGRLYQPVAVEDVVHKVLYYEPVSLIARAGHPLFDEPGMAIETVARFPLVLPMVSTVLEAEVQEVLRRTSITFEHTLRTSSVAFTRELLLTGDFVSLVPRTCVAGDIARGSMKIVPIDLPQIERPAGLIYRSALGVAGNLMLTELALELERLAADGIVDLPQGAAGVPGLKDMVD